MIKPSAAQTFRVSFNRAFRAPSYINNNIDTTILNQVDLRAAHPLLANFVFPIRATGNTSLKQETLTAYEIGYAGVVRRLNLSAAVYWNNTEDGIFFTPDVFYTAGSAPPTWPGVLPTAILSALAQLNPPVLLPAHYTYLNFGEVRDKGVELGVEAPVNRYVNVFANYAHQWKPTVRDLPPGTSIADINWPAENHFNVGFDFSYSRFLGNLSVHYTDEAYWQDVLDVRYAGITDAYTLVNGTFGVRWLDNRITTSLKMTNLGNQQVQQHIFGDVMKRQIVGEVRLGF
jgi:outer membrane receptor protein involved in Fe transport